jgi:hypothetical protein
MADRNGWAYGFQTRSGEWLTVVGSAYEAPKLRPSREDAEAALSLTKLHTWKRTEGEQLVTAHVTETWHSGMTGPRPYAYRITAGTAQPAAALTGTTDGRWFLALLQEGEEAVDRLRKAMAGELPLEGLDEQLLTGGGARWTAAAPDGTPWDLRWFLDGRCLVATTGTPPRVGHRAKAPNIQAARLEAVRISHLIASDDADPVDGEGSDLD